MTYWYLAGVGLLNIDVGLRPTVKRCLTILPIDTSKALLNSSHSTEVPQWVLEDIITTTLQGDKGYLG